MFVVKYHFRSKWHPQMDWHRWNIHCSYFLVFVEITVDDLKGGRTCLWNFTLNVQQVTANYGMISRLLWSSVNKHSNRKSPIYGKCCTSFKISLQINIYIKCKNVLTSR
jgi:hypothetical protein